MSLEKPKSPELGHEHIAPTALGVAYRRAFADIPYAKEIFSVLEREANADHLERLKNPELATIIEARYRLVSSLAKSTGASQFLEIASGFASRGLEFTEDPETRYVEFDQPKVIVQKERIIGTLHAGRTNLSFAGGDALDLEALSDAVRGFDAGKPITILNEGLMRYLNFEEKARFVGNVHHLLAAFGGQWVTPDITLKSVVAMENRRSPGQKQALATVTGMNIDAHAFEDVQHAERFFTDLGFSIEKHSFLEVANQLVSPSKLAQSEQEVQEELRDAVAFVMRPL